MSTVSRAVALTALAPGSVLGEVDDGLINFVANIDEIERGEVAGYSARVSGGYRQLFPRISRADYSALLVAGLPEAVGVLETMVDSFHHLTLEQRASFVASRKVVRQPVGEDSFRYVVVPRVPEALTEIEILDEEGLPSVEGRRVHAEYDPPLEKREKRKKYPLANVLNDRQVLEKYPISTRGRETARRVAAVDPAAACDIFQHLMNECQSSVAVSVFPGEFARNKAQAANVIRQVAGNIERNDAAVESVVVMNNFTMLGPGGELDWCVTGPLSEAVSVSYVYWLVRAQGRIVPSVLLAMELVLLGIDIYDGDSCQEPDIEFHASRSDSESPPVGVSSEVMAIGSAGLVQGLNALQERLLPLKDVQGRQLATAVRVTDRYVLVNSHVVDTDNSCEIDGERVVVHTQMSRDMWSVRNAGQSVPWLLREPVRGETVVICYLSEGQLSTSAPLVVTSYDDSCVVTTKHASVSYGMSGGALVSLSDFALLGIHSASTQVSLMAYRFGSTQFSDLLDSDSVSSFSRHSDVGSFAQSVSERFKHRGLTGVMNAAVKSLEPIFVDGLHCGTAVNNGEYLYTACDPDLPLRLGVRHQVGVFETVKPDRLYRVLNARAVDLSVPVVRRSPEYFEKVFVMGVDEEDVYIFQETQVAHIGPDGSSFVLADFVTDKPSAGAIVLGWDGAFLGVCGRRSAATPIGLGFICWPIPQDKPAVVEDRREPLQRKFPFMNLRAWPDPLLEEVFVHSSVGGYPDGRLFNVGCKPLANIGDNVAKAELFKSLREFGFPHAQWSAVMQSLQSNAKMAEVSVRFGLMDLVTTGSGVLLQPTSKSCADVLEAFVGAAHLVEQPSVVSELCKNLGLVYRPPRPAKSLRSLSDFGVD